MFQKLMAFEGISYPSITVQGSVVDDRDGKRSIPASEQHLLLVARRNGTEILDPLKSEYHLEIKAQSLKKL